MNTAPQKISNVSPQKQQAQAQAVEKQLSTGENIEQIKKELIGLFGEGKVKPQQMVQLGGMSEKAIQDKALYPMVQKTAIQLGIVSPLDLQKGIDYQFLGHMVVFGKITEKMIQNGQLGAR
jgi:hypothetical protein